MKKFIPILLTVAFLSSIPSLSLATQKVQTSLTVHFADGVEIEIIDWKFEYSFGSSDERPTGHFYTPSYYETKDLMFVISKTERGVTFTDEKKIPSSQLKSIKFEYGKYGNMHSFLKKTTVQLSSGEIIEVDELKPAKQLLSKAKYVFEEKLHLKGTALVNNRRGVFTTTIHPFQVSEDNKERIVEITFGKK
jgi:hypothetical protein